MFAYNDKVTRAHLVIINSAKGSIESDVEEFISLILSAGAAINDITYVDSQRFYRRSLIGSGKIQEIKEQVVNKCSDLVVFNHPLTPSQERNLEQAISCRVIDRTRLILDIFAQRAVTKTGKLQVELAQLNHLSTRLVRGWMHLERQKGGIGLRGPGETQLETDRRLIQQRIKSIKKRLTGIETQRQTTRKSRNKIMKNVALVGYTNVGKSTLFNKLTGANILVQDKLFATLDPSFKLIKLPKKRKAILSDTVGFIKDLPYELIDAFLSTLEEVVNADLLIHVLDATNRHVHQHRKSVHDILSTIGADQIPTIYVYNKIDLLKQNLGIIDNTTHLEISAKAGIGIDNLLAIISQYIKPKPFRVVLRIRLEQSRERSLIFSHSNVIEECFTDENNLELEVEIDEPNLNKLKKNTNIKVVKGKLAEQSTSSSKNRSYK
ncbi:MAG: GTPase HflX [Gammaproteobacteria bacterium]|nr:GTPase HflX [Gammaproteobacteria bacterium]|tara:strand:+ start:2804 stop:4111 length:1308 start_codon:yes stop_codon:yes gene_type:complete